MTTNNQIKINQIDLICSIMTEIDKQHKGCFVSEHQTNVIIKAANLICDAFKQQNSPKTE